VTRHKISAFFAEFAVDGSGLERSDTAVLKLFFKLAVVALLANAAYRVGLEYLTYVKFRDAVRDAATYKTNDDEDLRKRIMDLAGDYDIPLTNDAVTIRREDRQVLVDGSYYKPIEVVPTFQYQWPFTWSIQAITPANAPLVPRKRQ